MSYIVKLEANWTALLALIKAEIELKPRNKYSELMQFWQCALASVCKIVKTVPKKPLLFCQTTAT